MAEKKTEAEKKAEAEEKAKRNREELEAYRKRNDEAVREQEQLRRRGFPSYMGQ
jgi:hypothetical protein